LTPEDARLLGFDMTKLKWTLGMHTANGNTTAAPVTLGDLRLGRIVEYSVPALVMRQGGISLLGMSFLERLRSWQISHGVLTIAS
jgi:clan AA aspartic protease (TIGR02281 family)